MVNILPLTGCILSVVSISDRVHLALHQARYGPRPNVVAAVEAYARLALEAGMSPTEMALR